MGKLFGTDGIRGVANVHPMTTEMAMQLGRGTAYIFKNKDSSQLKEIIKKLYYNEELIEKLGRNARRVVEEKYSKETYLEKLLQIYDSLLNEN